MKTTMLAAALWGMILGYWLIFHGVGVLQSLNQSASSGSGSGGPSPDEVAWLRLQPIPR